jgi:hypothetical protein
VPGILVAGSLGLAPGEQGKAVRLTGEVIDHDTSRPVASRVYLQGEDGSWHFPRSAGPAGSAVACGSTGRF